MVISKFLHMKNIKDCVHNYKHSYPDHNGKDDNGYNIYIYYIIHVELHQEVLVAQSCLTLCDPMDWSPPGFSVHGIL